MEKFYVVTNKNPMHKAYYEWKEDAEKKHKACVAFMNECEFETTGYCVHAGRFMIAPTDMDLEAYHNQLSTEEFNDGLKAFKKNSKVHKAFWKAMDVAGVKNLRKPVPGWDAGIFIHGKVSTRLLDIGDKLYCSIKAMNEFESPPHCIEIKASEFYKAIEDLEANEA